WTDADERATTAHHGFPGFKKISRIRSVRAHDSTPHEPGRSFVMNNLGKFRAPEPDSLTLYRRGATKPRCARDDTPQESADAIQGRGSVRPHSRHDWPSRRGSGH